MPRRRNGPACRLVGRHLRTRHADRQRQRWRRTASHAWPRNRWHRCSPRRIRPTGRSPQWQVYDTATSDCAGAQRHRLQRPFSGLGLTADIARLGLVAGRRDRDDRYAGGARLQRQLLGRLAVAGGDRHARPPPSAPPVLATQTPNQTWIGGKAVSLALPAATFTDPQGQTLTYTPRIVERPGAAGLAYVQRGDRHIQRHGAHHGADPEHRGRPRRTPAGCP